MSKVKVAVSDSFDINVAAESLAYSFSVRGYNVRNVPYKNGVLVTIKRNCGGINRILGLGESLTVYMRHRTDGTFVATFSGGDWTSKIFACTLGWLLCLVPVICGAVGICRQLRLPKEIVHVLETVISD